MKTKEKILLIDPVSGARRAGERGTGRPSTPNLGLLYIASYLRKHEDVEVFDMADKGIGGLRGGEGSRLNWASCVRTEPQLEVNDLTADDLLAISRRATALISKKRRSNAFAYNMKRFAFSRELLRQDRATLKHYIQETLKGKKWYRRLNL